MSTCKEHRTFPFKAWHLDHMMRVQAVEVFGSCSTSHYYAYNEDHFRKCDLFETRADAIAEAEIRINKKLKKLEGIMSRLAFRERHLNILREILDRQIADYASLLANLPAQDRPAPTSDNNNADWRGSYYEDQHRPAST